MKTIQDTKNKKNSTKTLKKRLNRRNHKNSFRSDYKTPIYNSDGPKMHPKLKLLLDRA